MKIFLSSTFHFGKHKGKDFKWIFLNDFGYLKFLHEKGFVFCDKCTFLIIKKPNIDIEIDFSIKPSKDELTIFEKKSVFIPAEKFVRKKPTTVILSNKVIETIDISNIPFEITERKKEIEKYDYGAWSVSELIS